ncbi:MAG: hypothetical protein JWP65_2235 [Ramlibacter sp.]|jgi:hypothetical protein|nr:hypothetical protein [Ramlibacter sp.]MDB5751814.1 hypothetical protein [Ramlibacter sp.]
MQDVDPLALRQFMLLSIDVDVRRLTAIPGAAGTASPSGVPPGLGE